MLLILSPVYSLQSSRRCLAAGLESCNEQGWNSHQSSTHTKQAHIHTLTHIQRHAHPHRYTYTLPQIPTHPYTYTESYILIPTYIYIYAHAHIYTPPTHTHRARALVIYHILMLTVYMCVCVCSIAQSCLTLWDPMDCSLPGSSVNGSFQARTLEWVAVSSSRGSSPGDPPYPGVKPRSLASPAVAGRFFTKCTTWEAPLICMTLAKNVTPPLLLRFLTASLD